MDTARRLHPGTLMLLRLMCLLSMALAGASVAGEAGATAGDEPPADDNR